MASPLLINYSVSSFSRHLDLMSCILQLLEQLLACFGPNPSSSLLNSSRAHGGNLQGSPGTIPSWQFGCVSLLWRLEKLNIMEIFYSIPSGISTRERSWHANYIVSAWPSWAVFVEESWQTGQEKNWKDNHWGSILCDRSSFCYIDFILQQLTRVLAKMHCRTGQTRQRCRSTENRVTSQKFLKI